MMEGTSAGKGSDAPELLKVHFKQSSRNSSNPPPIAIWRKRIPSERVTLQFQVVTTFSSFRSSDLSQSI
jgi:hypothetical protein